MLVSAKLMDARVSFKKSHLLSKELRGLKSDKAARLLNSLINQTSSLDGKYYTDTAKVFLALLRSAEANARQKNMDTEKLFVKIAKADKTRRFVTPKSRAKYRGREKKTAHLEIVLEER